MAVQEISFFVKEVVMATTTTINSNRFMYLFYVIVKLIAEIINTIQKSD